MLCLVWLVSLLFDVFRAVCLVALCLLCLFRLPCRVVLCWFAGCACCVCVLCCRVLLLPAVCCMFSVVGGMFCIGLAWFD